MAFIAASPLRFAQPHRGSGGARRCTQRRKPHGVWACAAPHRIRPCTTPADANIIHSLITQLAIYERQPDAVKLTADDYRRDGFERAPPLFFAALAEAPAPAGAGDEGSWTPIGLLLCYWKYSTWQGRALHVEDIFVVPERRRQGVGRALFAHAVAAARAEGAARLELNVLDWNTPAVDFYTKAGAQRPDDGAWWLMRMDRAAMDSFAQQ